VCVGIKKARWYHRAFIGTAKGFHLRRFVSKFKFSFLSMPHGLVPKQFILFPVY